MVAVTLGIYAQTARHDFVLLDDPEHVAANPMISSGLSWQSVTWAFTSSNAGFWLPLTWISHMVDWQLWGDRPGAHHLMNVAWHAANSVLLFWVLWRMTSRLWPAALAAALFAVHPLQVESVAWACERKNVLCLFFSLLTIAAYLGYTRRGGAGRYLLVAAAFAASLLAKPMSVTLPCVLLLLDYWPLRRVELDRLSTIDWRRGGWLVVEKLPLLALTAIASIAAVVTQHQSGALYNLEKLPIAARLANAVHAYLEYLRLFVWPTDLAVVYHHPFSSLHASRIVVALVVLLVISLGVVLARRRHPYLLVGWLWFLGTLVPMIGLLQAGNQSLADRFSYLPHIGLMLAFAWGLAALVDRFPHLRWPATAGCVAVLAALAVASFQYTAVWRDSITLFDHAVRVADNPLIRNSYGVALMSDGRPAEAEIHFRRATELEPRFGDAYFNLGQSLATREKYEQAARYFDQACQVKSNYTEAQLELSNALLKLGQYELALKALAAADTPPSDHPIARNNYAIALTHLGRPGEALPHIQRAVEIAPDYTDAWNNLAQVWHALGRFDEARQAAATAIEIDPHYADAHNSLGMALVSQGRFDEAIDAYRRAIEQNSDYVEAHFNLGNVHLRRGDGAQAAESYRQALQLNSNYGGARVNLGAALLQLGRPVEAAEQFTAALPLVGDSAALRFDLARALHLTQQWSAAEGHYRRALELDAAHHDARYALCLVLLEQNRRDEALAELHAALQQMPPASPAAQRLRDLLKQLAS